MSDDAVIKTLCTNCGAVYEIGRETIGQTAACASCNAEFEIQDYTDYINTMLSQQTAPEAAPEEVPAPAPEAVPEEAPAPAPEEVPVPAPAPEAVPEEAPAPAPAPEVPADDDGTVKMEPKSPTSTNTVRLPRVKAGTGMLPQVEGEHVKFTTQTNKSISIGTHRSKLGRKFSSGTNRKTVVQEKKKSFWDYLCFWKK